MSFRVQAGGKRIPRADPPTKENTLQVGSRQPCHQNIDNIMLKDAFKTLQPDEQKLIQLAYYEGLSHSQIVTRTRVPLGTVKSRLRSALIHLRHHLELA